MPQCVSPVIPFARARECGARDLSSRALPSCANRSSCSFAPLGNGFVPGAGFFSDALRRLPPVGMSADRSARWRETLQVAVLEPAEYPLDHGDAVLLQIARDVQKHGAEVVAEHLVQAQARRLCRGSRGSPLAEELQ